MGLRFCGGGVGQDMGVSGGVFCQVNDSVFSGQGFSR